MKKLAFIALLAIFSLSTVSAQDVSFGVTTGYHNLSIRAKLEGVTASNGESGVFAGFFADIPVSEKFHVQPEVLYAAIFADGESGNELVVPILAKYYVSDQFFAQAGPVIDIILDDAEGLNAFGFGLGFGAGYDFSETVFATARYSLGINDRLDADLGEIGDLSTTFNIFQIGVGYRF